MADENIRVRLNGMELIWLKSDDGTGALAPLEHIDAGGNVNFYDAFCSNSYAHVVEGGDIMRYRQVIGTVEDLEFLPEPNNARQ